MRLSLRSVSKRRVAGDKVHGSVDAELRLGGPALAPCASRSLRSMFGAFSGYRLLSFTLDSLLGPPSNGSICPSWTLPHPLADLVEEPTVGHDEKGARARLPTVLEGCWQAKRLPACPGGWWLVHQKDIPTANENSEPGQRLAVPPDMAHGESQSMSGRSRRRLSVLWDQMPRRNFG